VNLTFGYDKAKVLNGGLFEFAFVVAEEEFVFMKSFEDQSGDVSVLLDILHEDEDVVKVDTEDSFHDEVLEDVVHHGLKVEGELVSLKNITKGSKSPQFIQNTAFH
jgi:hypothetical protein